MSHMRYIRVLLMLLMSLVLTAACSIDFFPENKEIAELRLYSFEKLSTLEPSAEPIFYSIRIESDDPEGLSLARDIIVFAMMNDGTQKDLFSVSVKSLGVGGMTKLHEDENFIYLYRSGDTYVESQVFVEEGRAFINRDDTAPFIIQYEKITGEVSEKDLGDSRSKIVLELFSYNDELNCLLEWRTRKPFIDFSTSWGDSVGSLESLNPKVFGFRIIANSLLNVRGCLVGDDYYFPAINGIYKLNLQTNEITHCLEKDYQKYDYVQIFKWDNSFIVAEEKIVSYRSKYRGDEKEVESRILEYSLDFQRVLREAPMEAQIDETVMGNNGIMVYKFRDTGIPYSQGRIKNSLTSVYCCFSDFSFTEMPKYSGENLKSLSWKFIDESGEFWLISNEENDSECKSVLLYKENNS